MNAFVNQDACIGCGLCCGMCETVFRMNDEGKAEAYQAVAAEDQSEVQSAMDASPVSAISWEN